MPPKTTGGAWNPDAIRDLVLAVAMSENGKKPTPSWAKVEGIMADWGYGFTACAIKQQFNRKVWGDLIERRGGASPAKTDTPSTPKKRGRKPKAPQTPADSDSDLSDAPAKKRKVSAKNGHGDEDGKMSVKKEMKDECV